MVSAIDLVKYAMASCSYHLLDDVDSSVFESGIVPYTNHPKRTVNPNDLSGLSEK